MVSRVHIYSFEIILTFRPWCGGTLINARYVLTAAHCLHRKTHKFIQVVLGDHDWTDNSETTVFRSDILEIIRHPFFGRRTTFDNDFALLRLKTPVDWAKYPRVRPACMPGLHKYIGPNVQGWASGWGVIDPNNKAVQAKKLQKIDVYTMPQRECEDYYDNDGSVTDTMMCAKSYKGGDSCYGDSGGPFVNNDDEIIGVVSWGKSCAKPQWPGVYARISSALNWIYSNTQDSTFCERLDRRPRRRNDKKMRGFE